MRCASSTSATASRLCRAPGRRRWGRPTLRRARPRASILAVIDGGVPVAQVYQAGAMNAVQGDVPLVVAAFRSLAENRRDLITGGARADHDSASFNKLRRIVGGLRSGLI